MVRCWYPTTTTGRSIGSATSARREMTPKSSRVRAAADRNGALSRPRRWRPRARYLRQLRYLMGIVTALAWLTYAGAIGAADLEAGRRKAEVCAECHGAD